MLTRRFFGLLALLGLLLLTAGTVAAFAAANTVPPTHAADESRAITANDLKPAACAALNLTTIVTGSGNFSGTNGNDLILGSAGADQINGLNADDCIMAGDGDDVLRGQGGNDVCDGGGGTDAGHPSCEVELNVP